MWITNEVSEGANDAIELIREPLSLAVEQMIAALPADVRDAIDQSADVLYEEVVAPVEEGVLGGAETLLQAVDLSGQL